MLPIATLQPNLQPSACSYSLMPLNSALTGDQGNCEPV